MTRKQSPEEQNELQFLKFLIKQTRWLLSSWGLREDDFFLHGQEATALQGYNVPIRKNYVGIIAREDKIQPIVSLPQNDLEGLQQQYQVIPAVEPFRQQYLDFVQRYNCALHIGVGFRDVGNADWDSVQEEVSVIQLQDGTQVRVISPFGDIRAKLAIAKRYGRDYLYPSKITRWQHYAGRLLDEASQRDDDRLAAVCRELIGHLSTY